MELKDLGLQKINLDLSNNITENFFAKEGDVGTRGLSIKVLNNSVEIDTTGVSITMYARVGQEVYSVDAIVKDALKGEYELIYPTSILKSGIVYAELQLKKLNNIISTKKFKILVESGIVTDSAIEGHDSYPIFEQLLEAGANEITRKSNEEIRKLNEIARDDAENLRGVRLTEVENDLASHKEDYVQHKEEIIQQRQQDNLKVATVEKELNDYKSTIDNVNVNQEVKQKVTGYGTISLPKNTANGQVSVSVKGRTYSNMLGTHETKDEVLNLIIGENISIRTNGGISGNSSNKKSQLISGNKYLIKIDFLTPTTNNLNVLRVYDGSVMPNSTELGKLITSGLSSYTVFTAPSTDTVHLSFRNNVGGSNYYHDKTILVDLTSIGETETDVNKLIQKYKYVNNTKSTISASRLKSVGKNLFDGKLEQGSINITTGIIVVDNDRVRTKDFIRIDSIPDGIMSGKLSLIEYWLFYDINKKLISTTSLSNSFIRPTNAVYVKFRTGGSATPQKVENWNSANIQLEEGTVATPYEPYKESTQYLTNVGELRSLPNGTRDEVRMSEGKMIKRISDDYILKSSDILEIRTELSNIDYAAIKLNSDISSLPIGDVVYIPSMSRGWISTNTMDNVENIGKWGAISTASRMMGVALSKGTTLVQARQQFSGLTLIYRLANDVVTPIQTSGNLISYPSGTIYVENVVADAGVYTTKFDIKELQLPIKSIDKLIKYNFTTGVQTVLDTSLAVINADKKSFTHPNLTDKDMVFVDYFYDVESTLGETTIEYLDSRHTIKDSVNNKFYKWDIKSANGVPTVELTEVL